MKAKNFSPALTAVAIATMFLPMAAQAAEADLLTRIEALTKELQSLKAQVQSNQQNQQKAAQDADAAQAEQAKQVRALKATSLGNWLTVGGDYQLRVDSLRGETQPFTDVNAVFANAQNQLQSAFFADPSPTNAAMLTGLMNFSQGMNGVQIGRAHV